MEPQPREKILVKIDPVNMVLVGMVAGFVYGLLMVALDPWLRFPDVPIQVNWREALLTASLMGGYAAVQGWTVTTFWQSRTIWLAILMMTPIITGVVAAWNNSSAALGLRSDLLAFLPFVLVFHGAMILLTVLYLKIALHFPERRRLAFTAAPVVLSILAFVALGRVRWSNQDARDIVAAVDRYALGAVGEDYKIEYLGIRYSDRLAPTGNARIHTDDETFYCQVRLYLETTDISCRTEEE